ncbi:DUF1697 domain-containing protein [Psychroflexus aestuariivivens]|uniref:DUF1697 domain-containing protein n=1 Tax=Psychroflexus aestuariivivens TaxID=1795040 RepID=UPI000FDA2D50|nr:DUF1697 domain-containing protein [Psychroflexus aestuariivivens]
MDVKIALLRGINVGGKRKILMADLRQLLEQSGFENPKTYIQSGNVVFKNDSENSEIAEKIEQSIAGTYGFEVPVIVKSAKDFEKIVDENPFREIGAIENLHLTFLKKKPSKSDIENIQTFNFPNDKFIVNNDCIYLYCQGPYHKTKLSNTFFEKKLSTGTTTRNWKTTLKLLEIANSF